MLSCVVEFEQFADEVGPRLRAGLVAAYGPVDGLDAAAEALAYGWEHRDELSSMLNPAGYLYRVGQSAARRARRRPPRLPVPSQAELPDFEPGLVPALQQLTEPQRVCVLLVHSFGWSQVDTADLLGVGPSTVRTHLARGLSKLRNALEVEHDIHIDASLLTADRVFENTPGLTIHQ